MVNRKQPEIRFSGYTDDWEERKLGDLSNVVGGGTPNTSNPDYWNGDIDWYAPAEIGAQIYVSKSKKTITKLGQQKSSARILPVGTVLFTSRAGIGNTAILAKESTTNQGFQSIVPDKDKLDSYFIFSRTNELKRYGEVTGAGSTFVEVSGKQMAKMTIMVPEIKEQQKIGLFFKQLDDTIVLHQRKLELLKEQKKGFLQKMFPKAGANTPEVRFAGFIDDWEQRKLDDLMNFSNGINAPKENYGQGRNMISVMDILSSNHIEYSKIKNSVLVDKTIEDKNKVEHGDLVFVRSSEIVEEVGWTKAYSDSNYALYSGFTIRGKKKAEFNSYFVELSLNFSNRKQIERKAGGSTRYNVSQTILNSICILSPDTDEQEKIGFFFKKLDDTIALHQRELELLKETKKGFLQKMFV